MSPPPGGGRTAATSDSFVLPKGTLLFTYFRMYDDEPGFLAMSRATRCGTILQQISRAALSQSIRYIPAGQQPGYFEIRTCGEDNGPSYFYPTPYGGLGVAGLHPRYNACMVVATTCDIVVSQPSSVISLDAVNFSPGDNLVARRQQYERYFQVGTLPQVTVDGHIVYKDPFIQHRNNMPPDINYRDLKFPYSGTLTNACIPAPQGQDIVNLPRYAIQMAISGIKSLEPIDALYVLYNNIGKPAIYTNANLTLNDTVTINLGTSSLRAARDAARVLPQTPLLNYQIPQGPANVNLKNFALINDIFCEFDRSGEAISGVMANYAILKFGNDTLINRNAWPNPGQQPSRVLNCPYGRWINYITGGNQLCFNAPVNNTCQPGPNQAINTPNAAATNLKIMPIGLIMATTGQYRFFNFFGQPATAIPNQVNQIAFQAGPNVFPQDINLNQAQRDARIRSFYVSSIYFFASLGNNTMAYNAIKKLLHLNLAGQQGFGRNSRLFDYNTNNNRTTYTQEWPRLRLFDCNLRFTQAGQGNFAFFENALTRMFKVSFMYDLCQTYLSVRYRHLKYNKGIYILNERINSLFNITNLRAYFVPGANPPSLCAGMQMAQIATPIIYNALGQIEHNLFADIQGEFPIQGNNMRIFTPNPTFSPLYRATYVGIPPSYLNSDTINPARVHSTPLYYFYRRLVLMINVDGNVIANWTVYTKMLYCFVAFLLTFDRHNDPDVNFLVFQNRIMVPAGFNYNANIINNGINDADTRAIYNGGTDGDNVTFTLGAYVTNMNANNPQNLVRANCGGTLQIWQQGFHGGKKLSKRKINKRKNSKGERKRKRGLTKKNKLRSKTTKLRKIN
jgi:hypothetical protein